MKHRLKISQSLSVHAKKVADNLSYQLLLSLVQLAAQKPNSFSSDLTAWSISLNVTLLFLPV